jgi:hypothetical protein
MAHTPKLTKAQRAALSFIAEAGGKSGGFYADFGHHAQTLAALWKRNFIKALPDNQIGFKYHRARWVITEAGRNALARDGGTK